MKNVLLYGVHSVNLGDDLFFKIILDRYPDTRFIIQAPEVYKKILSEYKNCIVVSNEDAVIKKIGSISRFTHLPRTLLLYAYLFAKYHIDMLLIAGGSIFIEGNSNMPKFLKGVHNLKRVFRNVRICIIGSNFGPAKTDDWKTEVRKALHYVDDICFRDIQSYNLFADLPNVRWANDIVLHQEPLSDIHKQKTLCINIRSVDNWPTLKGNKENYLTKTTQIITKYQELGYAIHILSFCTHYGDNSITDELFDMIQDKRDVSKLYYNGNLKECVDVISSADTILATRFHAIILGIIYGVKIIPVSYSIKSENMLKTLGMWNELFDYNSFCKSSIDDILDNVICECEINRTNNKQFDYIDKILK